MPDKSNWLDLGIIAFLGGIVANIIVPSRRGLGGFMSAAIIGIFCGGVAGIIAAAFEVHYGVQCFITAAAGVSGDQMLQFVLTVKQRSTVINNTIYGSQQQNIAQEGGDADIGIGREHRKPTSGDTD